MSDAPEPQRWSWHHCSPDLLALGVDCAETPRRPCECSPRGGHDHYIDELAKWMVEEFKK